MKQTSRSSLGCGSSHYFSFSINALDADIAAIFLTRLTVFDGPAEL